MKNLKGVRLATWIVGLIFGILEVIALIILASGSKSNRDILLMAFVTVSAAFSFADMIIAKKGTSKGCYIAMGILTILFGSLPVGILTIICNSEAKTKKAKNE